MPLGVNEKATPPGGVAGPTLLPKIVTISPGEIGPDWRLAAFVIARIAGGGAAPTVNVTFTV
jgi:hypothetical protein